MCTFCMHTNVPMSSSTWFYLKLQYHRIHVHMQDDQKHYWTTKRVASDTQQQQTRPFMQFLSTHCWAITCICICSIVSPVTIHSTGLWTKRPTNLKMYIVNNQVIWMSLNCKQMQYHHYVYLAICWILVRSFRCITIWNKVWAQLFRFKIAK